MKNGEWFVCVFCGCGFSYLVGGAAAFILQFVRPERVPVGLAPLRGRWLAYLCVGLVASGTVGMLLLSLIEPLLF